ncbi:MAG: hypothetical protein HWN79_15305 [Candidatus Lokiarchaeota archaeon]|nr:hypothetical protein [Candidatus Lokiarchaeota archaeon]
MSFFYFFSDFFREEFIKGVIDIDQGWVANNESKIIFFSADYSVKDKALALGAKYFLEKPFQLDKLSIVIEKIILES